MSPLETGVRVAVALVFAVHGFIFMNPPETVQAQLEQGPLPMRGFWLLGSAEVAGAAAVLLPFFTGAFGWLPRLAAACMTLVMVLATVLHVQRSEPGSTLFTVALGAALVSLLVRAK